MTQTNARDEKQPVTRYRVRLRTHLDSSWLSQFPVVRMTAGYDSGRKPVTTMIVSVRDQAEVMALLLELHGMGLSVLSLQVLSMTHKKAPRTVMGKL